MPGCTCLDTTAPTRANRRSPLASASPRPRIERGRHRVEVALDLLVAGLDLLEAGHRAARALGDPAGERLRPFLLRDVVLGDVVRSPTWDPEDRAGRRGGAFWSKPLPGLGVAARSQTGRNAARRGKCCSPPSPCRGFRVWSGGAWRGLPQKSLPGAPVTPEPESPGAPPVAPMILLARRQRAPLPASPFWEDSR